MAPDYELTPSYRLTVKITPRTVGRTPGGGSGLDHFVGRRERGADLRGRRALLFEASELLQPGDKVNADSPINASDPDERDQMRLDFTLIGTTIPTVTVRAPEALNDEQGNAVLRLAMRPEGLEERPIHLTSKIARHDRKKMLERDGLVYDTSWDNERGSLRPTSPSQWKFRTRMKTLMRSTRRPSRPWRRSTRWKCLGTCWSMRRSSSRASTSAMRTAAPDCASP